MELDPRCGRMDLSWPAGLSLEDSALTLQLGIWMHIRLTILPVVDRHRHAAPRAHKFQSLGGIRLLGAHFWSIDFHYFL